MEVETIYDQHKLAKFKTGKTHIIQWDLMINGMVIVRHNTLEIRTNSYHKLNLDPCTRLDLPSWCKNIKHFLSDSGALKEEGLEIYPVEKFGMLPTFWNGMLPSKRRVVMTVMQ